MADDAATELAKNIVKNMVPFSAGEDLQGIQQAGGNIISQILQSLGVMKPPPPPLNAPLPRMNPKTGQVEFPPGYQGPR